MARLFATTYDSCVEKVALDRQLSAKLALHPNSHVRNTAWRIARCSDDFNCWLINPPDTGWLHGRFWRCRSKLCSYCLSDESRRRRRSLREALDAYAGTERWSEWRFLTLTIENPSASISTTRSIVQSAWSKLRKRACFAAVRAGCKSEEFTLTKLGFHYHIHALLHFAKLPSYQLVRRDWTECVETSGGQSQRLFGFDTIDGYLIAQFKRIRDARNITNELCKYVTKSTDYTSMTNAAIAELAEQTRWHRMFEFLGELRQQRPPKITPADSSHSIVHTKRLSDGLHTDRQTFERKRSDQRYYAIDQLEASFAAKCFTLTEMQAALRQHQTL